MLAVIKSLSKLQSFAQSPLAQELKHEAEELVNKHVRPLLFNSGQELLWALEVGAFRFHRPRLKFLGHLVLLMQEVGLSWDDVVSEYEVEMEDLLGCDGWKLGTQLEPFRSALHAHSSLIRELTLDDKSAWHLLSLPESTQLRATKAELATTAVWLTLFEHPNNVIEGRAEQLASCAALSLVELNMLLSLHIAASSGRLDRKALASKLVGAWKDFDDLDGALKLLHEGRLHPSTSAE